MRYDACFSRGEKIINVLGKIPIRTEIPVDKATAGRPAAKVPTIWSGTLFSPKYATTLPPHLYTSFPCSPQKRKTIFYT